MVFLQESHVTYEWKRGRSSEKMLRSSRGYKVAVRQVGRTDQSKVTEVQITSKDFPSAATRIEQEVEAETRFIQGYRCRDIAAQLLGPDARQPSARAAAPCCGP
jgi:hypothetical protein